MTTKCQNIVAYSGSISQWDFIALKIQYTAVNYNSSNTRTTSTGSLIQLSITINSAPNNDRAPQALSHNSPVHSKSLSYIPHRHNHSNVSVLIVALLRKRNKPIVMQQ
jgi:hypothetical protein